MHRYIWLVPLLPLAAAAINGFFGRKFRFSEKLIGGIAVGSIALSFLITVAAVYSYAFSSDEEAAKKRAALPPERRDQPVAVAVTDVPRSTVLDVEWSYQLDALSAVFMLIVTGVGLCIFVFATGYMHADPGFYRFFSYMGLFM